MTDQSEILLESTDGVAVITLNRPDVMNAFTDYMRERLLLVLDDYRTDAAVRCIVITGAGKAFCAGGDIASMAVLQDQEDTEIVEKRITVASQVLQTMREMPQPIIGAINGPAAGGGMNLALGCDFRLGSEKALFSESFVKIGLVPDWGGFYFLPQLIGAAKAMEFMMTGGRVEAEEAYRLGLLNHLYPVAGFHDQVMKFAKRLASGPSETLARIKQGVYLGSTGSLEQTLAYEFRTQKKLFLADDAREGMRAFIDKRPPKFS